jgi:hypothetical protein
VGGIRPRSRFTLVACHHLHGPGQVLGVADAKPHGAPVIHPEPLHEWTDVALEERHSGPLLLEDRRVEPGFGWRRHDAADRTRIQPGNVLVGLKAERRLRDVVARYRKATPQLAAWLEENLPEALTVLRMPATHRGRFRTTNRLERLNREIKRRTRVATLFPNKALLLRRPS